jgi:hypothetical protein
MVMRPRQLWFFVAMFVNFASANAADVRDIEMRRLFQPTQNEIRSEAAGKIYIYDGMRESDIERAMDEEFDRVDNMMFIRVKPTSANEYIVDDGC